MKAPSMFALVLQPSPRRRSIILSFGLVMWGMGCTQADRFYAAGGGGPAPSFAPIVQEVMPAVVNVSAVQRVNKAAVEREGAQAGGVQDRVALSSIPPSEIGRASCRERVKISVGAVSVKVKNISGCNSKERG